MQTKLPAVAVRPCPFCGCSDVGVYEGNTFRWRLARCNGCGAQAGDVRVQTAGGGTRTKWEARAVTGAIAEWNKRDKAAGPLGSAGEMRPFVLYPSIEPVRPTKRTDAQEARRLKKALRELSDTVLVFLHWMDNTVGPNKQIPRELSTKLGKACTFLDMQNDRARRFSLGGLPITADAKLKAAQELRKLGAPNARLSG